MVLRHEFVQKARYASCVAASRSMFWKKEAHSPVMNVCATSAILMQHGSGLPWHISSGVGMSCRRRLPVIA